MKYHHRSKSRIPNSLSLDNHHSIAKSLAVVRLKNKLFLVHILHTVEPVHPFMSGGVVHSYHDCLVIEPVVIITIWWWRL